MIRTEDRLRALYRVPGVGGHPNALGLFAGANPGLPGLFGDPRDRLPNGVLSNPAAPPINVQPVAMPGLVNRALPTGLDKLKAALGSGLSTVFAGQNDPRLSKEENDRARKMALIQGGLAMMAASGPSAQPVNLAQILATGAMAGQQAGAEQRASAFEMAQQTATAAERQKMQQIIQSGAGVEQLRQMFQQAVAMGDTESARAIATVVQAAEATEREQNQPTPPDSGTYMLTGEGVNPATGKAEKYLMDRRTGEVKWTGVLPVPPRVSASGGGSGGYDPENDPVLQRRLFLEGMGLGSGGGTEDERKAAAFAGFVPEHIEYIDNVLAAPGRAEQILSDRGLREFTSAEQQQLQLAGGALAEAWLRMTTGSAYNDREFANAYNLFVPRPGDRKSTLEMKERNRVRLRSMLTTRAGRVKVPTVETPPSAPAPKRDALSDFLPTP